MILDLIKICKIPFTDKIVIDFSLPCKKINLIPSNKRLVTIHLSSKWINRFYTEENFLNLISQLPKKEYLYVLTTDNFTNKKFIKIYKNFKIINNKEFNMAEKIKNNNIILDRLHYENWVQVINSSKLVITPECGCTHIASACKVPVIIIYDSDNLPEAIYKEYHPWQSQHEKLVFNDLKLNEKIINNLT